MEPSAQPVDAGWPTGARRWRARTHGVLLRVPPPLVCVAAFLAGMGLQRLVPLPAPAWHEAGAVLLALGILPGPANALMFLARGTTLDPARPPRRLFTGGLYRFTRNPMYIGLLLVHAGVALLQAQPWALLFVVLPWAVVNRIYIPCEEQRMAEAFGEPYLAYCRRVRRWLGTRHAQA